MTEPKTETLGDLFPAAIEQSKEILRQYQDIGPPGVFGAAMIGRDIAAAEKAWRQGDCVEMLRLLPVLQNHE